MWMRIQGVELLVSFIMSNSFQLSGSIINAGWAFSNIAVFKYTPLIKTSPTPIWLFRRTQWLSKLECNRSGICTCLCSESGQNSSLGLNIFYSCITQYCIYWIYANGESSIYFILFIYIIYIIYWQIKSK